MEEFELYNESVATKKIDIHYDSLKRYINMIYELDRPILTTEEEKNIFQKIKSGDEEAKKVLIESNLRLVIDIAKKFSSSNEELLDNIQNGNIGLIKAIEKYKLNMETRFSSYAYYWIKKEILYLGYKEKKLITLPYGFREKYRKYSKAKIALQDQLKRKPTIKELSNYLELPEEQVEEIKKYINYNNYIDSLDFKFGESEEYLLYEFIKDENQTNIEDYIIESSLSKEIESIFKKNDLKEKEIEVLKLRNGFYNNKVYSLEEIAKIFNVTKQRISQIEIKALTKIRKNKKELLKLGIYLYESDKAVESITEKALEKANYEITRIKEKEKQRKVRTKQRKNN